MVSGTLRQEHFSLHGPTQCAAAQAHGSPTAPITRIQPVGSRELISCPPTRLCTGSLLVQWCHRPTDRADCRVSRRRSFPGDRQHFASLANAPQPHAAATGVPGQPSEVRSAAAAASPDRHPRCFDSRLPRLPWLVSFSRAAPARGPPLPTGSPPLLHLHLLLLRRAPAPSSSPSSSHRVPSYISIWLGRRPGARAKAWCCGRLADSARKKGPPTN